MAFCRGCATEINTSVSACPQCGALQFAQPAGIPSQQGVATSGNWYVEVLKKYAVFTGRARRKEYWMFVLINFGIALAIGFIEALLRTKGIFSNIYTLAMFIPSIAVGVRRLHDIDRSGWWLLLPIVNIVFLATEGNAGSNRFGPSPK